MRFTPPSLPMEDNVLISTIRDNREIPSFIELFLLDQFESMSSSTFHHIFATITEHLRWHSIEPYATDLHRAILLFIQMKSIYTYDCSFGERIYGLTRVVKQEDGNLTPMNTMHKRLCVLSLALPLVLHKLKELSLSPNVEDENDDNFTEEAPSGVLLRMCHWIKRVLRYGSRSFSHACRAHEKEISAALAVHKTMELVQQTLYLFQRSPSFHAILSPIPVAVVKRASPTLSPRVNSLRPDSITTRWRTIGAFSIVLGVLLVLRGLEWVNSYSTSNASTSSSSGLPIDSESDSVIKPPSPHPVARGSVFPPNRHNICPLCRRERVNPAASTGGYVFCYTCLMNAVQEKPACPITGMPCRSRDVIRILNSADSDN